MGWERSMPPSRKSARPDNAHGSDLWRSVGRRLAAKRAEVGCSAERIADAVRITAQVYKDYESGAPIPALLLAQIADFLDSSVVWFFEDVEVGAGSSRQGSEEDLAMGSEGAGPVTPVRLQPATYKVATIEHRIQALADLFRRLDFEGQQHLLAISRALSRSSADAARK